MQALKGTSMVALVVALFFTPYMAIAQCYTIGCRAFSQSAGGSGTLSVVNSATTGSSVAAEFFDMPNPVTAGNALVAVIYGGASNSTLSFTDTLGNTATMIASASLATDSDTVAVACTPLPSGGSDSLQFNVNGSPTALVAVIYEVHNSAGSATCTQDVTAVSHNSLASTSCNSTAMSTSTANDLLIAGCGLDGTQVSAVTAGSGWSGGLNAGVTAHPVFLMSEYRIGTSPGSFTATSGTFASEEQATLLVALKP